MERSTQSILRRSVGSRGLLRNGTNVDHPPTHQPNEGDRELVHDGGGEGGGEGQEEQYVRYLLSQLPSKLIQILEGGFPT